VHVGGIQERDARLRGRVEHGQRVGLGDLAPVRAQLPGAKTDDGDGTAGPAQNAFFHGERSYVGHLPGRPGRGPRWPGRPSGRPVKVTPVMLGGGVPGTWNAPMPCAAAIRPRRLTTACGTLAVAREGAAGSAGRTESASVHRWCFATVRTTVFRR